MKRPIRLLLYLLFLTGATQAKNLQARFAHATFFAPGKGGYVETYLNINGFSTTYLHTSDGRYQAAVEVNINFFKDNKVVYFDKYKLLSPETADTVNGTSHFTDVQRIPLPNGNYVMELIIRDNNAPAAKPYRITQDIALNYEPNVVSVSDIELLQSFKASQAESKLNRNGFELVPLVDNFYPPDENKLSFFAEIYNTSSIVANDQYLLAYHIETYEQKRVINDFSKMMRQTAKPVDVLLTQLDITELPTGNYNLVIEVRNRQNELLAARSAFFQRSKAPLLSEAGVPGDYQNMEVKGTFAGSISDRDSLAEYIRMLWPISSPSENTFALNQLEIADLKLMQQYFFDFWNRREPGNAGEAWNKYYIEVQKVNKKYGAFRKKGYMTERGRVYLQHGPPDQITEVYNEPNSYPYEIWQYYKLVKLDQTNRKFVFYNTELATNDFRLLHSDARGEVNEPQWQLILHERNEKMNDMDRNSPRQGFGTQTNQLFNNPR
jgi:GWxTD domain-containing protein